jgi:hypothetical protein
MILGMSTGVYTIIHVLISLIGIGSGLVIMLGFLTGRRLDGWNTTFLVSTLATSVTGFGFPFDHLLPSHKLGIISLVVLAVAIPARYLFHLAGRWRLTYVITAAMALYFNVFVLVAQCFQKVPALHALAPTQQEPPFLIAQLVVLLIFVGLTIVAARRFRVEDVRPARAA